MTSYLKRIFVVVLLTALMQACASMRTQVSPPSPKPNIVLILADDLGWGELGCYGQERIQTPNIDRLAEDGVRFTQFYAGSAVCAPSRCNLLTGMHGGHAYIRNNHEMNKQDRETYHGQLPIPSEEVTVAESLHDAGYATGCFGKWGLGEPGSTGDPLNQGFDTFFGYNCQRHAHNLYPKYLVEDRDRLILEGNDEGQTGEQYAPQLIADRALEFIEEHQDEPFFLYYPTVLPHLALQVPDEYMAPYLGLWPETPYRGKGYQPHETPRACYAGMISFLDHQVGRVMEQLRRLGIDDNTIVIVTSDNGTSYLKNQVDYEFFNSVGPLRGLKGSLYEGGIRVPLVARWPGKIQPGGSCDHVSANYDIPASLCDVAGVEFGDDHDGISFLPALVGRRQAAHEFLLWDFAGYGGQLAIRKGDWKAVKTGVKKDPDQPWQLYNLAEDISESEDVAQSHPELCREMDEILRTERTLPNEKLFRFGRYRR